MYRPIRDSLLTACLLVAAAGTAMADQLLLHQSLAVDAPGRSFLLVERGRIGYVTASKAQDQAHRITIHLATEPPVELELTCNDAAITRQVLEALRQGAPTTTIDLTGRCRL